MKATMSINTLFRIYGVHTQIINDFLEMYTLGNVHGFVKNE
jgi:hypothetical protein